MNTTTNPPWMLENYEYGSGVTALHGEIEHFYNYSISTAIEFNVRMEAICRIENVVLQTWPSASIEVFGSFSTGLSLPISDIDISVNYLYWNCESLHELANALAAHGVAQKIKVLDKARVPVLKCTERISQVKFDISLNMRSGVQAADLVKMFIAEFPELPKLVIVLKHFLSLQGLNRAYKGGISSYALTLMCISFLQRQALERTIYKSSNIMGILLVKFLDYYGRKFDYHNYGVSVRRHGGCAEKTELQENLGEAIWISLLTIEDPITPTNDITRNSYHDEVVRNKFLKAFTKLSIMVDLDASKVSGSILGSIISVPEHVIDYRNWMHYNFLYLTSIEGYGFTYYFNVKYEYDSNMSDEENHQKHEGEHENNFNDLSLSQYGCQNTNA